MTMQQMAQATDAHPPASGAAPADAHAPAEAAPADAHGAPADAHGAPANPADGTHAGTEVPGGEHHGPFPPFDSSTFPSQLLWLAIAFGLLYFLMSRLALPRVGGILNDSQQRIMTDLHEANRLKAESEAAAAAYEQELAQARNNAVSIGQKARDAAKADADAKRAVAEGDVASRIAKAEASIAAAKSKAMQEVGGIANETAEAILRSLTGGSVSKADIEKAVKAQLSK
jgi:F-type H+-transporting ATPase subunit b